VNEGKVLNNPGICLGVFRKKQAIMPNARPMGRTMNAIPVDAKFLASELIQSMTD